jgi:hypothetical protein
MQEKLQQTHHNTKKLTVIIVILAATTLASLASTVIVLFARNDEPEVKEVEKVVYIEKETNSEELVQDEMQHQTNLRLTGTKNSDGGNDYYLKDFDIYISLPDKWYIEENIIYDYKVYDNYLKDPAKNPEYSISYFVFQEGVEISKMAITSISPDLGFCEGTGGPDAYCYEETINYPGIVNQCYIAEGVPMGFVPNDNDTFLMFCPGFESEKYINTGEYSLWNGFCVGNLSATYSEVNSELFKQIIGSIRYEK